MVLNSSDFRVGRPDPDSFEALADEEISLLARRAVDDEAAAECDGYEGYPSEVSD